MALTILTLYNSARVEHLSLTDDIQHFRLTPAAANKAMDRQTELLTIQRQLEEDWPEIRYRVLLNEVRGITIMPFGDRVSISTIRRRPVIPAPYIVTENAHGSSPANANGPTPAQESSAIAKGFRRFTTRFFPVAAPVAALQASSTVSRSNSDYDYFFKIALVGDGKSCLILRFADNIYTEAFISTIGVDSKLKTIAVDGSGVKLQLFDTQTPSRRADYISLKGMHAVIITFDVTNRSSFDNVTKWIGIVEGLAVPGAIVTLAATKCDAPKAEWKVSEEEIKQLADYTQKNVFFTSAKAEGNNSVEQLFEGTAHALLQKRGVQPSGRQTITP